MAEQYFPPVLELVKKEDYLLNTNKYIPFDGSPINLDLYTKEQLQALNIPFIEKRVMTPFTPASPENNQCTVLSSAPEINPANGGIALPQFALQPFKAKDPLKPGEQFLSKESPGNPVYIGLLLHPEIPEKTLIGIKIVPRLPAGGPVVGENGFSNSVPVPTVYQLFGTHDDISTVKDADLDRLRWEVVVDVTRMDAEDWDTAAATEFMFSEEAYDQLKYKGFKLVIHEWDYSKAAILDSTPGFYRVDFVFMDDGNVLDAPAIPAPEGYLYAVNLGAVEFSNKLKMPATPAAPEIDVKLLMTALIEDPMFHQRTADAVAAQSKLFTGELDSAKKHFTESFRTYQQEMSARIKNTIERVLDERAKRDGETRTEQVAVPVETVMLEVEAQMTKFNSLVDEVTGKFQITAYDLEHQIKQSISSFCAEQQFDFQQQVDAALEKIASTTPPVVAESTELTPVNNLKPEDVVDSLVAAFKDLAKPMQQQLDALDDSFNDMNETHLCILVNDQHTSYTVSKLTNVYDYYVFSKKSDLVKSEVIDFELDITELGEPGQRCQVYHFATEPTKINIKLADHMKLNLIYNGKLLPGLSSISLTAYGEQLKLISMGSTWYGVLVDGPKTAIEG